MGSREGADEDGCRAGERSEHAGTTGVEHRAVKQAEYTRNKLNSQNRKSEQIVTGRERRVTTGNVVTE